MKRLLALVTLIALCAAPVLADPTGDVKNAMIALMNAKSYHMSIVTAGGHSAEVDVVNPGRLHLTAGPIEAIVIDTSTYIKMQGSWRQLNVPGMDRMMSPMAEVQRFAKDHDNFVVTDLGMKVVEGVSLHAYSTKTSGSSKTAIVYLDANGMPVRLENTDSEGRLNVVRITNFNGPITIEAPV